MIKRLANYLYNHSATKQHHDRAERQQQQHIQSLQQQVKQLLQDQKQQQSDQQRLIQQRRIQEQFEADCRKLEFLTRSSPDGARELLRDMPRRYPDLVSSPAFQQLARAFLEAETETFRQQLDQLRV